MATWDASAGARGPGGESAGARFRREVRIGASVLSNPRTLWAQSSGERPRVSRAALRNPSYASSNDHFFRIVVPADTSPADLIKWQWLTSHGIRGLVAGK